MGGKYKCLMICLFVALTNISVCIYIYISHITTHNREP